MTKDEEEGQYGDADNFRMLVEGKYYRPCLVFVKIICFTLGEMGRYYVV